MCDMHSPVLCSSSLIIANGQVSNTHIPTTFIFGGKNVQCAATANMLITHTHPVKTIENIPNRNPTKPNQSKPLRTANINDQIERKRRTAMQHIANIRKAINKISNDS